MANLQDLVGDIKSDSKKVMSVKAQSGRKRFWNDDDDAAVSKKLVLNGAPPIASKKSESEKLLEMEAKLEKAEKKIKQLENSNVNGNIFSEIKSLSIRNNIKKFLFAIAEESIKQKSEWPNISTNKLRKHYKVTADSFKYCLTYGLEKKLIERKKVSYSGNVNTWCYKLLKDK